MLKGRQIERLLDQTGCHHLRQALMGMPFREFLFGFLLVMMALALIQIRRLVVLPTVLAKVVHVIERILEIMGDLVMIDADMVVNMIRVGSERRFIDLKMRVDVGCPIATMLDQLMKKRIDADLARERQDKTEIRRNQKLRRLHRTNPFEQVLSRHRVDA